MNRKDILMNGFKSKIGFSFSHKDMQEFETIIDFYEKENKQLQNNWNELMEDIPHILEMVEHNKDVIKVTSDEELAIYSLQNKMQEIKSGNNE